MGSEMCIRDRGVLVQPGPSAIELMPAYGFSTTELLEIDSAVRAGIAQVQEQAQVQVQERQREL